MAVDVELHRKNTDKYVITFLELTEKEAVSKLKSVYSIWISDRQMTENSELEQSDVERIGLELERRKMLEFRGTHGNNGRGYVLSLEGLEFAEKLRYDKTLKAKWRKSRKWAWDITKEAGKTSLGKAAGYVAVAAGSWVIGYRWHALLRWLGL